MTHKKNFLFESVDAIKLLNKASGFFIPLFVDSKTTLTQKLSGSKEGRRGTTARKTPIGKG